jgi:hypothetical protein
VSSGKVKGERGQGEVGEGMGRKGKKSERNEEHIVHVSKSICISMPKKPLREIHSGS